MYDETNQFNVSIVGGIVHVHGWDDERDSHHQRLEGGRQFGYISIGEIVAMMKDWARQTQTDAKHGFAMVFTREMYFPTKTQAAREVVWSQDDDWYYKPLWEAGKLC